MSLLDLIRWWSVATGGLSLLLVVLVVVQGVLRSAQDCWRRRPVRPRRSLRRPAPSAVLQ